MVLDRLLKDQETVVALIATQAIVSIDHLCHRRMLALQSMDETITRLYLSMILTAGGTASPTILLCNRFIMRDLPGMLNSNNVCSRVDCRAGPSPIPP
ncbi:hypothetical protein P8452_08637 [Trifolium repens]|nr:hypothetical protein P8452_08637 [Trifolium repens]